LVGVSRSVRGRALYTQFAKEFRTVRFELRHTKLGNENATRLSNLAA